MIRFPFIVGLTAIAAAGAFPAQADTAQGTVIAFDRVAKRLVMRDKTVFDFREDAEAVPATLSAGDLVTITYDGLGEDGIGKVSMIEIISDVP